MCIQARTRMFCVVVFLAADHAFDDQCFIATAVGEK